MPKKAYHPNAYLIDFRNIAPGLKSRTQVLNALENGAAEAKTIVKRTELNYRVVLYHLKLLETRRIVRRRGGRPFVWSITGLGQKRLKK